MSEPETHPTNPAWNPLIVVHQPKEIARFYRQMRTAVDDVEKEKNELQSRVQKLESENQLLKFQLKEQRRRSFIGWVLSLFALIFSGMGINYVTGDNQALQAAGGLMIVTAVVLEFLSYWILSQQPGGDNP